ncbi:dephospho-CoA kinase [Devosia pacifica]|uniref:Dephospho-CoA kinase n=1 Tax=Devosia pacifica TaxID=1335967 RepID=A0A918S4W9_9HYPH|nr:dephospho-CoA kinase [Devosia pacifica]GHA23373.1 dephospho-CoA kinase [Devosia pacifica]
MWRIGLTGSIATGKSTVLRAFTEYGAKIFSADEAVHELYEGPAVPEVTALFPGVAPDGRVDRSLLSAAIAREPEKLMALESRVHPMVRHRIAAFMDEAEADGALVAVVEVPLLFETGHDYGFDAVGVTICPEDVQRQRALARPGMSVEKLESILARQLPQEEKRKRATYVFDTSDTIEETKARVRALVAGIQARGAQQ